MAEIVLSAELRQETGKHAKYARSKDTVPGVYYSRGESNLNIQVATPSLDKLVFTAETHVIDLRLKDGSSRKCILRDVQFDPVSDRPIHFDLQGLKENEKLTVEIPIVLVGGTSAGVREGGMLQHIIHRLKVSCLPKDIPERIEVNVSGLAMNQAVHVSELTVPNVTILESPESTVVAVLPPHIVKEAAPTEVVEEVAKEPEVVGKGKKEEEGEEGKESGPPEKEKK